MKDDRRMMGRIFRLLEIDRILAQSYRGETPDAMLSVKEIYGKLKELESIADPEGKEDYEIHPQEEKTIRKDLDLFLQIKTYLHHKDSYAGHGFEIIEDEKRDPKTGRNVKCYSIPPGNSLFRHRRSDWETEVLKSILQNLDQFDIVKDLRDKIQLPKERKTDAKETSSYLPSVIDLTVLPPKNPKLIYLLVEAITDGKVINIHYRKIREINNDKIELKAGEKRNERLLPLQLKRFDNRWVLIGAVESNDFIVNFSLDQIDSVEFTGDIFPKTSRLRMKNLFSNVVGPTLPWEKSRIKSDNKKYQPTNEDDGLRKEDVVFYALPNRSNHIEKFPVMDHGIQKKITAGYNSAEIDALMDTFQGGKVFKLENVYITRELKEELFKRMDDIIVISPSSLRNEMAYKIKNLHSLYSTDKTHE